MKRRNFAVAFSFLVIMAMLLAACGNGPAATTAPVTTEAPATAAPTEAVITADPNFEPMVVSAESCDYGGEFKSIEAVDEYTVKFTLCAPDPAFPSKVAFSVFAIQDKEYLDANSGDSVKMSEAPNGTAPACGSSADGEVVA